MASFWIKFFIYLSALKIFTFVDVNVITNRNTMADEENLEEKERKLRLRNKILDEIISSEESYITQLDMLLNVSYTL